LHLRVVAAFEGLRRKRLAEVNAKFAAVLAAGYPLEDYPGETLQCLTDRDRTNWLYVQGKCEKAAAAGFGDAPYPEPGLRCTSNSFIRPTIAGVLTILDAMGVWAEGVQANVWRLKDAVEAVEAERVSDAARFLAAIDIDAGWS
jgi:hypothetical protein